MTCGEYIKQLLEIVRHDGASGDLARSLPGPEKGDEGMYAVWKVVCDPHFRQSCKRDPMWYARAQSRLEDLAGKAAGMSRESSEKLIREFLEEFMCRMLGTGGPTGQREEPDRIKQEPKKGKHLFGGNGGEGIVPRADQHEQAETDELLLFEKFGTFIDDIFPGRAMPGELPGDENAPRNGADSSNPETDKELSEEEEEDGQDEGGKEEDDGDKPLGELIKGLASKKNVGASGLSVGNGMDRSECRRRENKFLRSIPKELLRLAKLIGRSGSEGFQEGGTFPTATKSDITGITVGDNLNALLPSELAMLSSPATQDVFYRNFVSKRLQVFASASSGTAPEKHQDGPVIICLDTSGSMIGEKVDVACALTIAVTIIAQRRHRSVLVIKYSDWHFLMKITNIHRQMGELVCFLSKYSGMGNNENELFRWVFDDILPSEKAFDTADILCVTDFGWDELLPETKAKIREAKDGGLLFYGLNILGTGEDCDRSFHDYCADMMRDVCDSLWCYRNGKCWEDWNGLTKN